MIICELIMKILLTGSEGFIGSHLAEKLVKLGYKVKKYLITKKI